MKFWSKLENKMKTFDAMPADNKLKAIVLIILVAFVLVVFLKSNPVVLSIEYDEGAYDNYIENRKSGYSFHTTDSGKFYTTHGIHPFDVEVVYLFGETEDLVDAFDNGNITIEDLDRLDFDYWFMADNE